MRIKHFILFGAIAVFLIGGVTACSKKKTSAEAVSSGEKKIRYHCPMHTTYISDRPGNCPICNMQLVPIEDDFTQGSSAGGVEGQCVVKMRKESEQQIGVAVAPVEKRDLFVTIKAPGRVAYDP